MKKAVLVLIASYLCIDCLFAGPTKTMQLLLAPASVNDQQASLLWNKQEDAGITYQIKLNGSLIHTTTQTHFTCTGLSPNTKYVARVVVLRNGKPLGVEEQIQFTTPASSKLFNVLDFGAKADDKTVNTKAIQAAIDACTKGGTVYIPKGEFLSGALYLKSNMTLWIDKDAVLKGTTALEDYLPMYLNRFEGWELQTYASLINAGTLNRDGSYNVKHLRITGGGTISGGGRKLGDAMIKANGMRSRGRLICLMNCQDVYLGNLTIEEPPSWTIHYIYSDKVTCEDLTIKTYGIRNGDGIDPDSSTDSYFIHCIFDTGDDCIAIKSGKNPEGYYVGKPTTNVQVKDCDFIRGHGISIGSEMSGGVSDVLVEDCKAGALLNGMQIKGTKDRGGYVRNVTVRDCQLLKITIFTALNYNNDGEAAPVLPTFENFVFKNLDLSQGSVKDPVININGFKDPSHKLKNVSFTNIVLPSNANVLINDAEHIRFSNVKTVAGSAPEYIANNTEDITH